jgi:predicted secreted protein
MLRKSDALRAIALASAVTLGAALGASQTAADESREAGRRVRFSVESAREVPNDWIRAELGVTAEHADPAALADTVNRAMAWALEQARAESTLAVQSGSYQTHPVYEDGRLRRWRASQILVLEGAENETMTRLVGALQERLQLQSFGFSVSPEAQAAVEEALVGEALAAFQARAEQVRRALGARGYAIDEIGIGTSGGAPPPIARARMQMEAFSASAPAPPSVEGGTSRVIVSASGTIVLE